MEASPSSVLETWKQNVSRWVMRFQHFLCDFVLSGDAAALVADVIAALWVF